ncbi:hypothetical protein EXIGLDRAFT_771119 [Exidia glandulosa HHB12029]|uniref:Uncharacterized protein n=1 Tax=Exidia glandulosa HHB12029 TaxID=1314781 RepID=A0A165G7E6_EXIGL|nr:hypothetical protein EXIGLDRAFT_771119 [Exidia glandulosa HHB12029]
MHVCLGGSLAGATYARLRKLPVREFSYSAGVNSTLVALAFFGAREYIISPALVAAVPLSQYRRRRDELEFGSKSTPLTWGQMRTHNLLDSTLAGAGAATLASVLRNGRTAALGPASLVGALLCTFFQYTANEIGITRVKLVSSVNQHAAAVAEEPHVPMLDQLKDALGQFTPVQRDREGNEGELEQLKRQKEESDRKLVEVRAKLQSVDEGNKT